MSVYMKRERARRVAHSVVVQTYRLSTIDRLLHAAVEPYTTGNRQHVSGYSLLPPHTCNDDLRDRQQRPASSLYAHTYKDANK
jgi:hypothetical protein